MPLFIGPHITGPQSFQSCSLLVNEAHHRLRIAVSSRDPFWGSLINQAQVFRGKLHIECTGILLQVLPALRARDRNNIFALRQHPGERQL